MDISKKIPLLWHYFLHSFPRNVGFPIKQRCIICCLFCLIIHFLRECSIHSIFKRKYIHMMKNLFPARAKHSFLLTWKMETNNKYYISWNTTKCFARETLSNAKFCVFIVKLSVGTRWQNMNSLGDHVKKLRCQNHQIMTWKYIELQYSVI